MSRREALIREECPDCAAEGVARRIRQPTKVKGPGCLFWMALVWIALAIACLALPWDLDAQQKRFPTDSSAVIVIAPNFSDYTYNLFVLSDSTYQWVGRSVPHTPSLWVLPSANLKTGPQLIFLWMMDGSHAMTADTMPRKPGIVNVYKHQFGEPSAPERRS